MRFIKTLLVTLAFLGLALPAAASTITVMQGTDTLSSSRGVINTNFANLNSDKLELVTYPLTKSGTTISIAFSTSTSNTWASTQTFGNIVINGTCTGTGCGSGGSSFSYPFPGNATSTTLTFSGGLLSVGSTTINGNATTTGSLYLTAFDCSGNTNSGKLTVNAAHKVICGDDISSGGGGTIDGSGAAGMLTGWFDTDTVQATSSPKVANIQATSTTLTSTFSGPLNIDATTGRYQIGGSNVLYASTSNQTTYVGFGSGASDLVTGAGNTGVGLDTLASVTTGDQNTAVGAAALKYNTASRNTAIGYLSQNGNSITQTGSDNTSVGYSSLWQNTDGAHNTAIGVASLASATTADGTTAVGENSLAFYPGDAFGSSNDAFGYTTLVSLVSGGNNAAFGRGALHALSTGSYNTALGNSAGFSAAGDDNVFLGDESGFTNTGSGSVFIGKAAGYNESGSNKLYIANSDTSSPLIGGDFSTPAVTINGDLTVTGTCTGCGGGGSGSSDGALGVLQMADGSGGFLASNLTFTQSGASSVVESTDESIILRGALSTHAAPAYLAIGSGLSTIIKGYDGGDEENGDTIEITAGSGGITTGEGGSINIQAGNALSTDNNGGNVIVQAGQSGGGSGVDGTAALADQAGNIFLVGGISLGFSSNAPGVESGGSNFGAYFDTTLLTGNVGLKFPDTAGVADTFCLQTLANCGGGGSGFSTTSADYWKTVRNFFSTTSEDYYKSVNNYFSTTSTDYYKSVNNFFSTTSANYWSSTGAGFSTTSANYWSSTGAGFSTTSQNYWETQLGQWKVLNGALVPTTTIGILVNNSTSTITNLTAVTATTSTLFFPSGGVINWNLGDLTLTHTSNTLTLAGGDLALGANNLTITGSIGATGARSTKGWFTNLESTNAPTVGGAAVYYTGGTDVAIADGGSNASSYTAANGLLAYNSTAFVNYTGYTLTSSLATLANATTTNLTSSYFYNSGSAGFASTTPAFPLSVNGAGSDFYVTTTGKVVGRDTTAGYTGRITPTRWLTLQTGTTTSWTASTTGTAYSPYVVMPFTGTLQQAKCTPTISGTAGSFIGVNTVVNGSNATPSYFVASSTVGTETYSAGNTFTAGQIILLNFGTSTTATATSVSCTLGATETP